MYVCRPVTAAYAPTQYNNTYRHFGRRPYSTDVTLIVIFTTYVRTYVIVCQYLFKYTIYFYFFTFLCTQRWDDQWERVVGYFKIIIFIRFWSVDLIVFPFWEGRRWHEQVAVVVVGGCDGLQVGRPFHVGGGGGRLLGNGRPSGCRRRRRRRSALRFRLGLQLYPLVLVRRPFQRTVVDAVVKVHEQACER